MAPACIGSGALNVLDIFAKSALHPFNEIQQIWRFQGIRDIRGSRDSEGSAESGGFEHFFIEKHGK
jgi:hypothetical protein